MRSTLLNFRSPTNRTAEYRSANNTYLGANLQFAKPPSKIYIQEYFPAQEGQASNEAQAAQIVFQNIGSNFARETRFQGNDRHYCRLSGQSEFVGPGQYHQADRKKDLRPCTAVLKQSQYLTSNESKKQCYIMIGDQIKYDPTWIQSAKDLTRSSKCTSQTRGTSRQGRRKVFETSSSRQLLSELRLEDNPVSLTQAINVESKGCIQQLKQVTKARRSIIRNIKYGTTAGSRRNLDVFSKKTSPNLLPNEEASPKSLAKSSPGYDAKSTGVRISGSNMIPPAFRVSSTMRKRAMQNSDYEFKPLANPTRTSGTGSLMHRVKDHSSEFQNDFQKQVLYSTEHNEGNQSVYSSQVPTSEGAAKKHLALPKSANSFFMMQKGLYRQQQQAGARKKYNSNNSQKQFKYYKWKVDRGENQLFYDLPFLKDYQMSPHEKQEVLHRVSSQTLGMGSMVSRHKNHSQSLNNLKLSSQSEDRQNAGINNFMKQNLHKGDPDSPASRNIQDVTQTQQKVILETPEQSDSETRKTNETPIVHRQSNDTFQEKMKDPQIQQIMKSIMNKLQVSILNYMRKKRSKELQQQEHQRKIEESKQIAAQQPENPFKQTPPPLNQWVQRDSEPMTSLGQKEDKSPTTSNIKIKEIKDVMDNEILNLMQKYRLKNQYRAKINNLMKDEILKMMQKKKNTRQKLQQAATNNWTALGSTFFQRRLVNLGQESKGVATQRTFNTHMTQKTANVPQIVRNIDVNSNSDIEIDYDTSIELKNLTEYFDVDSHKSGFSGPMTSNDFKSKKNPSVKLRERQRSLEDLDLRNEFSIMNRMLSKAPEKKVLKSQKRVSIQNSPQIKSQKKDSSSKRSPGFDKPLRSQHLSYHSGTQTQLQQVSPGVTKVEPNKLNLPKNGSSTKKGWKSKERWHEEKSSRQYKASQYSRGTQPVEDEFAKQKVRIRQIPSGNTLTQYNQQVPTNIDLNKESQQESSRPKPNMRIIQSPRGPSQMLASSNEDGSSFMSKNLRYDQFKGSGIKMNSPISSSSTPPQSTSKKGSPVKRKQPAKLMKPIQNQKSNNYLNIESVNHELLSPNQIKYPLRKKGTAVDKKKADDLMMNPHQLSSVVSQAPIPKKARREISAASQTDVMHQIDQNMKGDFDNNVSHQISFESNSVIDPAAPDTATENINFVGNVENLDSSVGSHRVVKISQKTPSVQKVVKPLAEKQKKSPQPKMEQRRSVMFAPK